jgi:hypothetical protein
VAADYDSPWKEALDLWFEPFLALLFPAVHVEIDWSRGHESLDKEFQAIVREAETGRRYVDKLAKVWTRDGAERWVLIHVEVQTARDADFPERMYVYNYRIFDRYNQAVASLAVLADDDPNWRPSEFRQELFGCETRIRFPTAKLVELAANEAELEASENPFSKVVLAHLKALASQGDSVHRRSWKIRLIRNLYDRGMGSKDVRELFRVIDWLMELPEPFATRFWKDVEDLQEEKRMPFVSTPERVGEQRGLRKGIEAVLRIRFGPEGLKLMPEIEEVYGEDRLRAVLNALETAGRPEDVRSIWMTENETPT